jgi:hypothetical protein
MYCKQHLEMSTVNPISGGGGGGRGWVSAAVTENVTE